MGRCEGSGRERKNEGMQKRGREGGRKKGRDELEVGRGERRWRGKEGEGKKERQADKDYHPCIL